MSELEHLPHHRRYQIGGITAWCCSKFAGRWPASRCLSSLLSRTLSTDDASVIIANVVNSKGFGTICKFGTNRDLIRQLSTNTFQQLRGNIHRFALAASVALTFSVVITSFPLLWAFAKGNCKIVRNRDVLRSIHSGPYLLHLVCPVLPHAYLEDDSATRVLVRLHCPRPRQCHHHSAILSS